MLHNGAPALVIADVGEQVRGVAEAAEGNGHVHGGPTRELGPGSVFADYDVCQRFADR